MKTKTKILVWDRNALKNIGALSIQKKIAVLNAILKTTPVNATGMYGAVTDEIHIRRGSAQDKRFGINGDIVIDTDLFTG